MGANKNTRSAQKTQLDVCIGKEGLPVGELAYVKDGAREYSVFAYSQDWLRHPAHFAISPDLALVSGHQVRKPPTKDDTRFFLALADTEPDAWGRRVIARAHAKERKKDPSLKALTELDYLCAVDDYSRIGALRLRNDKGDFLRTVEQGMRATAPLLELEHIFEASRAVERSQESTGCGGWLRPSTSTRFQTRTVSQKHGLAKILVPSQPSRPCLKRRATSTCRNQRLSLSWQRSMVSLPSGAL